MSLIDSLDSYVLYTKQQLAIIDASQQFGGYIEARDWPMTPPIPGALYLLHIASQPTGGTESQILYTHLCQWTWLLIGTDIQSNQQAENRGDRMRSNFKIMTNLRNAYYPGFCAKQSLSVDSNGNVTQQPFTSPSVGGAESVWWTRPDFKLKEDNTNSGLIYGTATVRIYAFEDVLASVA